MPVEKSVVITGASTGIGQASALHLDKLGWRVFAGIRNDADAAALRAAGSPRLTPLTLDVSSARSVAAAKTLVAKSVGEAGLAGLVNNAAIAYGGPVEFLDIDEVRRTFEVNFFGLIAVTQAFLPLLRSGHGRIVNISSISGRVASPFLSPYSASKFALEALSDALRVELKPWDIQVVLIEPGAIDTPIWNKGVDTMDHIIHHAPPPGLELYSAALQVVEAGIQPHGISTEHVTRAVVHALTARRARTRYAVGPDATLVRIFRLLPDWLRDRFFVSRFPKWG